MPAAHPAAATAAAVSVRMRRGSRLGLGHAHQSVAAGDDTPDRFTRLRIVRERRVLHALLHLETAPRLLRIGRNGLVNVGRHTRRER